MKKSSKIILVTIICLLLAANTVLLIIVVNNNKKRTDATDSETTTEARPEAGVENTELNKDRPNADTGTGEIKELSEGDVAPDFTAELVSGGSFKLSDYDDKIVLLNFWATWCPPCVREMPAFQRLLEDGIPDLEIICINDKEDKASLDSFIESDGYTFNIGYDVDGSIGAYYPSNGIPYTLVINKGKIEKIYLGALDADTQYAEYKDAINSVK